MSGQTVTMPEAERVASRADGPTRSSRSSQPAGLDDLAEQLVEQARQSGIALTGPDGLLSGLTRQVLHTALETELTEHLGHERGGVPGPRSPSRAWPLRRSSLLGCDFESALRTFQHHRDRSPGAHQRQPRQGDPAGGDRTPTRGRRGR
jgi:hypothetical protein